MKFVLLSLLVCFSTSSWAQSACLDIFSRNFDQEARLAIEQGAGRRFVKKMEDAPVSVDAAMKEALDLDASFRPFDGAAEKTSRPLELGVDAREIISQLERVAAEGDAVNYIETIRRLEQKLQGWSKAIGNHERSFLFDLRKRFVNFKHLLKVDIYEAIALYSNTFKAVELNYFLFEAYYRGEILADMASPQARERRFKELGEAYGEYKNVRKFLEREAAKEFPAGRGGIAVIYRDAARNVLNALRLESLLGNRFPDLKDSTLAKNPALNDIETFFRSHPEPLKYKLLRDYKEERKLGIWLAVVASSPVKFIEVIASKFIPDQFRLKAREFIDNLNHALFESRVRKAYGPSIFRIELAHATIRQELFITELARFDGTKRGTEFLETYARYVNLDKHQSWLALKQKVAKAAAKPTDYIYKPILDRMNAAEKRTAELGLLTDVQRPSLLEMYSYWIWPGITTAGVAAWSAWQMWGG